MPNEAKLKDEKYSKIFSLSFLFDSQADVKNKTYLFDSSTLSRSRQSFTKVKTRIQRCVECC